MKTSRPAPSESAPLRHGYTTGACAAAAALGASIMLSRQESCESVILHLPGEISAGFNLYGQSYGPDQAACFVIKDAGDDPDVTNGCRVHVLVETIGKGPGTGSGLGETDIIIEGGTGIGKITKPGLALPPGEWAINPVPRQMIMAAVRSAFQAVQPPPFPLKITVSIPDGEERSKRTLNSRLGIIGGLSVLGTTGIVRPVSAKAWTDTIDSALDVARACGCETVVLSTGRTSEMAAMEFFSSWMQENGPDASNMPYHLPFKEEAFVMMGDHIAHAVRACVERGFRSPVIACQFAKLLKIACGHENTHAAVSELDLATLSGWIDPSGQPELVELIRRSNTARELAILSGYDRTMTGAVFRKALSSIGAFEPSAAPSLLLADYAGKAAGCFP